MANDADKKRLFLKELYDGLQLQLMSNEYPNYQTLVNLAIVVDNKRKEMDAKRKRMHGQASGSNTRPRTNQQQGSQQRYHGHLHSGIMVSTPAQPVPAAAAEPAESAAGQPADITPGYA